MPATVTPASELGHAIRYHRNQAGLTQQDLADAIGTTQATVSRWESGSADVTRSGAIRIEWALNLPKRTLVGLLDSGDMPGSLIPWLVSSSHPFAQRVSPHLTVAA